MEDSTHNHDYIMPGSYPSLRKIAATATVQDDVINQTRTGARPSQILSSLRLAKNKRSGEENPIFKPVDVYNIKSKARSEALGLMTSLQALVQALHRREDWFIRMEKNDIT